MGRLTKQAAYKKGIQRNPISRRTYAYQKDGKLESIDDLKRGKRSFQYDNRGRLKSVMGGDFSEVFSFDPANNLILSETSSNEDKHAYESVNRKGEIYVEGNRLLLNGDCKYSYDEKRHNQGYLFILNLFRDIKS